MHIICWISYAWIFHLMQGMIVSICLVQLILMGIVNHTLHKMLKTRGGLISPEEPQFITDPNVLQKGFFIEFRVNLRSFRSSMYLWLSNSLWIQFGTQCQREILDPMRYYSDSTLNLRSDYYHIKKKSWHKVLLQC